MKRSLRYFYYFPATDSDIVFKHLHLYEEEVMGARESGIDIRLVCFISLERYVESWEEIRPHAQKDYLDVVIVPLGLRGLYVRSYFLMQTLLCDQVIIYARKVSTEPIDRVKRLVGDKVRYALHYEGDTVAENQYLRGHDEYDLYDIDDAHIKEAMSRQRQQIANADQLVTGTQALIDRLNRRYEDLSVQSKATTLPLPFPEHIRFDPEGRTEKREVLGVTDRFVCLYLGSASLGWQNVDRTLELFDRFREELDVDPFMVLLIPENDHPLVEDSIARLEIPDRDYLLTEAPHEEVNSYLNAADLGIVLRDDHPMNRVSYPSKLIEYLAAGLPVLTTTVMKYSDEIQTRDFGVVVRNLEDDKEIIEAVRDIVGYREAKRRDISRWAEENMEETKHVDRFIEILLEIGQG